MNTRTLAIALLTGCVFGFGLAWSTMVRPEVVLDFLRWRDFGLLFVLGAGVIITGLTYQLAPRLLGKPLWASSFGKHFAVMNSQTIVGAALFGVGWGLCGVCPGPAIAGLGVGNWPLLIVLVGMFSGAYVQGRVASWKALPPQWSD